MLLLCLIMLFFYTLNGVLNLYKKPFQFLSLVSILKGVFLCYK